MAFRANYKLLFFDQRGVLDRLDRAERRVLSKFGSYVRRRARSSIRSRKKTSQPGQPPSSHKGTLKRLIFFSYDVRRKSVVIGPVLFSSRDNKAPERLEKGGTRQVAAGTLITIDQGTGRGAGGRFTSGKRRIRSDGRRLIYKPRPYMGPAQEAELPKLPDMWRNSVK